MPPDPVGQIWGCRGHACVSGLGQSTHDKLVTLLRASTTISHSRVWCMSMHAYAWCRTCIVTSTITWTFPWWGPPVSATGTMVTTCPSGVMWCEVDSLVCLSMWVGLYDGGDGVLPKPTSSLSTLALPPVPVAFLEFCPEFATRGRNRLWFSPFLWTRPFLAFTKATGDRPIPVPRSPTTLLL